ncbi:MAG: cyclophilin-like fold protein [Clostridia bacterium]|jgi:hypothetical protein|nr:cyclophilin-like fold protein [Clostridia bacterium]MCI2015222.1 cyclophilin-like fold protein [Clostridia bacterium]
MRFYQRMIVLLTIFIVLFSLTGCSSGSKQNLNKNPSISNIEQAQPENQPAPSIENTKATSSDVEDNMKNQITLTINDTVLTATLADNSSAEALKELLAEGPLTIAMQDYGSMEKVGPIGTDLPTNNEQITTEAGDLILYMGNAFVIYYAPNSWNFTRLGKINDVSAEKLRKILGSGDVDVTLELVK